MEDELTEPLCSSTVPICCRPQLLSKGAGQFQVIGRDRSNLSARGGPTSFGLAIYAVNAPGGWPRALTVRIRAELTTLDATWRYDRTQMIAIASGMPTPTEPPIINTNAKNKPIAARNSDMQLLL
jgi:hypothetical protein